MPRFNLFGKIKDFLTETVPKTFRTFGSKIGQGLQDVGGKIGGFKNVLSSGYGALKKLPILGPAVGALGGPIEKGLDILGESGNLLTELGKGNIGGAVEQGTKIGRNITGGFLPAVRQSFKS